MAKKSQLSIVVLPEALTETDPAADMTFLFGLAVQEISGQKARLMPAR